MGDFAAVLRLVLERGWALGLLTALFFGLIYSADRYGFSVPEAVRQWSVVGLAAGAAIVAVSCIALVIRGFGSAVRWLSRKRNAAQSEKEDAQTALLNMHTLGQEEIEYLLELLKQPLPRIEVHNGSNIANWIPKGILKPIGIAGPYSYVCEIHPAILKERAQIISDIEEGLRSKSGRPQGEGPGRG